MWGSFEIYRAQNIRASFPHIRALHLSKELFITRKSPVTLQAVGEKLTHLHKRAVYPLMRALSFERAQHHSKQPCDSAGGRGRVETDAKRAVFPHIRALHHSKEPYITQRAPHLHKRAVFPLIRVTNHSKEPYMFQKSPTFTQKSRVSADKSPNSL